MVQCSGILFRICHRTIQRSLNRHTGLPYRPWCCLIQVCLKTGPIFIKLNFKIHVRQYQQIEYCFQYSYAPHELPCYSVCLTKILMYTTQHWSVTSVASGLRKPAISYALQTVLKRINASVWITLYPYQRKTSVSAHQEKLSMISNIQQCVCQVRDIWIRQI